MKMNQKFLYLLLAGAMTCGLCACSGSKTSGADAAASMKDELSTAMSSASTQYQAASAQYVASTLSYYTLYNEYGLPVEYGALSTSNEEEGNASYDLLGTTYACVMTYSYEYSYDDAGYPTAIQVTDYEGNTNTITIENTYEDDKLVDAAYSMAGDTSVLSLFSLQNCTLYQDCTVTYESGKVYTFEGGSLISATTENSETYYDAYRTASVSIMGDNYYLMETDENGLVTKSTTITTSDGKETTEEVEITYTEITDEETGLAGYEGSDGRKCLRDEEGRPAYTIYYNEDGSVRYVSHMEY